MIITIAVIPVIPTQLEGIAMIKSYLKRLIILWQRLDKKALAISLAILAGLIVLNIIAIMFGGGIE